MIYLNYGGHLNVYCNNIIKVNRSDASMLRIQPTLQLKKTYTQFAAAKCLCVHFEPTNYQKNFLLSPNVILLLISPPPSFPFLDVASS